LRVGGCQTVPKIRDFYVRGVFGFPLETNVQRFATNDPLRHLESDDGRRRDLDGNIEFLHRVYALVASDQLVFAWRSRRIDDRALQLLELDRRLPVALVQQHFFGVPDGVPQAHGLTANQSRRVGAEFHDGRWFRLGCERQLALRGRSKVPSSDQLHLDWNKFLEAWHVQHLGVHVHRHGRVRADLQLQGSSVADLELNGRRGVQERLEIARFEA
jgi:hypothetical protein